jgi:HSP20 family molecular chaperone IbpA
MFGFIDSEMDRIAKMAERFEKEHLPAHNGYVVNTTEDGKIKLVMNVVGHNPKDVDIEVNEGELLIKAIKPKDSAPFVKNVDINFTIGRDYDGTTADAQIENGLLTLTFDKKEEMKSKKVKIKF